MSSPSWSSGSSSYDDGSGGFVGVNMVQPEDAPIALRDYTSHMKMVGFLKARAPEVRVSLHAGELVKGLKGVGGRDLSFHINEAVEVAGADRIGHGVDLVHERDPEALTARMRRRHVLVEAPLISNAQILRVSGDGPPAARLPRPGVPVALATDDPGVSRTDLSDVYQQGRHRAGVDRHGAQDTGTRLTGPRLRRGPRFVGGAGPVRHVRPAVPRRHPRLPPPAGRRLPRLPGRQPQGGAPVEAGGGLARRREPVRTPLTGFRAPSHADQHRPRQGRGELRAQPSTARSRDSWGSAPDPVRPEGPRPQTPDGLGMPMRASTDPARGAGNCALSQHGPQPGTLGLRPRPRSRLKGARPQSPDRLTMPMRASTAPCRERG